MTWVAPPPYPAPPKATVYLTPGTGQPTIDITAYLSQETGATLTSTIENPTTTNNFTAADVTLKGYDPTGYIKGLLSGILPGSTDFAVFVNLGLPGTDSVYGGLLYNYDVGFDGFIAPATVQFNTKDRSFSFTVVSSIRRLQTTSAAGLFQRSGYYATKWTLQQDADPIDNTIRVTGPNISGILYNYTCDFVQGDLIQLGGGDSAVVVDAVPDASSSPPLYWQLVLGTQLGKKYAVGTSVVLLTPYQRNLSLESIVSTLFAAAGFPAKQTFNAPPLPGVTTLFASPVPMNGLPVGAVVGVAPGVVAPGFQAPIFAGTQLGLYSSPDAAGPFTISNPSSIGPLIDDTNNQAGYIYQNAPKRVKTRAAAPRYGLSVAFKFYAYDGKFYGGTQNRYCLTVTCNADVDGFAFAFSSTLSWEKQNLSDYSWSSQGTLQALASGTTTTDLGALYDAIGIEVDSATGTCFFTDLQNSAGIGSAITMNTSAWQPTGATIATGTYQANKATGVNGPIVMLAKANAPGIGPNSYIAITQVDGVLGKTPSVFVYSVAANGTMTLFTNPACSPYLMGRTIKNNRGDTRFYALLSDPDVGISIVSWSSTFAVDALSTPILLTPPPPRPSQSQALLGRPYEVDLCVLQNTGAAGAGAWPFVGLFGGVLYSIAATFTNVIAYADATGLSVADMLQQLSLMNAGIFYVVPSGWAFRSRAVPGVGYTIGINDQIDGDAGMLSLVQQNVFNRWVGYVRFENENDATIYGEAGTPAFADTDQGLTLKSRFIPTTFIAKGLALSLYNYLGAQKRWVEIERVRDNRVYEIGRTFHANVDGANRNFQIIETGHPVTGVTVKVVGLEV
jgi:hypothetical protein